MRIGNVWALQDLNLGPMDYESTALTAELRALSYKNPTLEGLCGQFYHRRLECRKVAATRFATTLLRK